MAAWSDLPIDVLEHLTSFLPLPDYHHFSVVCRNWGIVAKARRHSPAKQLPWLLSWDNSELLKCKVFSVSENRHYNNFPELKGNVQHVCGLWYSWLFTMDIDLNFRLLNPLIMGKQYDLPPLPPISYGNNTVIRYVKEGTGDPSEMTYEDAMFQLVDNAIIDKDPNQTSDFTVLLLYGGLYKYNEIIFWRPGDLVWTPIKGDYFFLFDDITFFKGNFYANAVINIADVDTCVTYLVDVGPDPKLIPIAPQVPMYNRSRTARTYLVDLRGELMLLHKYHPVIEKYRDLRTTFVVYKLDLEEAKYYRKHHLNGYSIFLGECSPLVVDCGQFPGGRENSIYFPTYVVCDEEEDGADDMFKGSVPAYCPPEIYKTFSPDYDIMTPIWWTPNPW